MKNKICIILISLFLYSCSQYKIEDDEREKYSERISYILECEGSNTFYNWHSEESVYDEIVLYRNLDSNIGLCDFWVLAPWEVHYMQRGDTLFFSVPKNSKINDDYSAGLEMSGYIKGDSIYLSHFSMWESMKEGVFIGSCKGIKK